MLTNVVGRAVRRQFGRSTNWAARRPRRRRTRPRAGPSAAAARKARAARRESREGILHGRCAAARRRSRPPSRRRRPAGRAVAAGTCASRSRASPSGTAARIGPPRREVLVGLARERSSRGRPRAGRAWAGRAGRPTGAARRSPRATGSRGVRTTARAPRSRPGRRSERTPARWTSMRPASDGSAASSRSTACRRYTCERVPMSTPEAAPPSSRRAARAAVPRASSVCR